MTYDLQILNISPHHRQEAVGKTLVGCLGPPGHVEDGAVLVHPDELLVGPVHGVKDGLGGLTLIRDVRAVHVQIQLRREDFSKLSMVRSFRRGETGLRETFDRKTDIVSS